MHLFAEYFLFHAVFPKDLSLSFREKEPVKDHLND